MMLAVQKYIDSCDSMMSGASERERRRENIARKVDTRYVYNDEINIGCFSNI